MTLLHLRYFCETARCESISQAAANLHISQPALSKIIHLLENDLGVALFEHQGRNIYLTHTGRFLYEHIGHGLSIIDHAISTVSTEGNKKELTVCVKNGDLFMDDIIVAFHRLYPDVVIIITHDDMHMPETHKSNIDFIIRTATEQDMPLSPRKHMLFSEEFGLVVPMTDPLAKKSHIHLREAASRRFLGTEVFGINQMLCQEAGFSPKIIMAGQNINTYLKMLECGTGVTIAPSISISTYLPENCRFIPLLSPRKQRTIILEEAPSRIITSYSNDFIRFCIEKGQERQQKVAASRLGLDSRESPVFF